jgi:hypothetical protein
MNPETKNYLTQVELKHVVPRGRKVFKLVEIDQKYEHYYTGFTPPELQEADKRDSKVKYWYDLGIDKVKVYSLNTDSWSLADLGTPKFAADLQKEELVGQVEDVVTVTPAKRKTLAEMVDEDI